MPIQDDLIFILFLECDAAKHLYTKLPKGKASLAYRPTPGQRSTLELLRYLSYCGIGACHFALEGNWDGYQKVAKRGQKMPAGKFPAAMDRQKKEIAALLSKLSAADFSSRMTKNPAGQEMTLGRALLEMPTRWLGGYRMQLFLYARALGADVSTPDCWYGVSMARKAKQA